MILADDMGWSDLSCMGGEIATPHLDALAAAGLRFTQFYNTGRCCPTRASLLTGLYPHQAGVGHMTSDSNLPGYRGELGRDCVTIAEVLRAAHYRTYACGKWHVCRNVKQDGPRHDWPLQRGFDEFYGTLVGAANYFDPSCLCRGNTFVSAAADPLYQPEHYYLTDAISDNAVAFLAKHGEEHHGEPFFLYVAFTAAHWPMQAPVDAIEEQRGRYAEGYEASRAKRFARQREMGLIHDDWQRTATAGDWDEVRNPAWEQRCMETYAAMVHRMDAGIGRIVAEITRQGMLDDTLILYLQDNGACAEDTGRDDVAAWHLTDLAPMAPEALQPHYKPPMQTRDGLPVLGGPEVMPGPANSYIAYGRNWANVSNTPFREYKHWVHEGGIATPLIVHWPAAIAEKRRGDLESQPAHLIDVMATCVDVAGAVYPKEVDGIAIQPAEGASLRPAMSGASLQRSDLLYWEHEGNRAVRDGRFKLVAKGPGGAWELYDMEADRTEMHDLAAAMPDRVAKLAASWNTWAQRARVLPWPWTRAASAKRSFELTQGADLRGADAPDVGGRALHVAVHLTERGRGVIVAHGGATHGYALWLDADGVAHVALRHGGRLATFDATRALPEHDCELVLDLARDGQLTLQCDGRSIVEGKGRGPLRETPQEGCQVGDDAGVAVGGYSCATRFTGVIDKVSIKLDG